MMSWAVTETGELPVSNARRKILLAAVSALCQEAGFDSAEEMALETLVEILQSLLVQLGQTSHMYSEQAGRVQPVCGDVVMAFVECGVSINGLDVYAIRTERPVLATPSIMAAQKTPSILTAGERQSHPSYIPDHMPPFPDPHAYIHTPTHKQPETEYEAIREKSASQKRDTEKALTRLIARTGPTQSLLDEDTSLFRLIATKPTSSPHLMAMLPRDQIFDEEEEVIPKRKREESTPIEDDETTEGEQNTTGDENRRSNTQSSFIDVIDNPYLKPAKLPMHTKRPNAISRH